MNAMRCLGLVLVVGLAVAPSAAQGPGSRQYYSRYWQRNGGYYYRTYYYQPRPAENYRHHYVVHYASRPNYYYYYNPYSKRYWGRYDRRDGKYASLAPDDQKQVLADIPEQAFPKPGNMPDVPETDDGVKLQKPPDDLPPPTEQETLPKEKVQELQPAAQGKEPPRQGYSDWCQQGGQYYCTYYCQPTPTVDYSCHRCIYYPTQPNYVYYYNPHKNAYWGRYDLKAKGYSLLAEADRKAKLVDIPEKAFPPPGEMPPLPGATDGTKMIRPPQTLPE